MSRIIEKTVYGYDELSEDAKQTAREWCAQGMFDDSWWYESAIEHIAQIGAIVGITIEEIRKRTGYSAATVTRALQGLSSGIRPKPSQGNKSKPGLELITVALDAENWRTKTTNLTDKGKALLKKIDAL